MQETPDADKIARDIAEDVYAAFAHQATSAIHPSNEQVLLTRLVEMIRPHVGSTVAAIIAAANTALDDWEQTNSDVRGPRVDGVLLVDRTVSMRERLVAAVIFKEKNGET